MDAAPDLASAQEALMDYCLLASDYTVMRLCKYNMHVMLCRLAEQELIRGGAASCSELWVERVVQFAKSSIRYRATSFSEVTLARDVLMDMALATCKLMQPAAAQTFDEHVPQYRTAEGLNVPLVGGNKIQDQADEDGTLMLGYGARVMSQGPQHRETVTAMRNMLGDISGPMAEAGWDTADLDWLEDTEFIKYKAADLASEEIVHGMEYKRARSRKSYFVLCHFSEADGEPPSSFILRVRYFVVAELHQPEHDHLLKAKLAVGDMWRCKRVYTVIGSHWEVQDYESVPPYSDWGVRLVDINRKVMIVHPTKVARVGRGQYKAEKCKHRMFLEYSSRSRDQRNKVVDSASISRRDGADITQEEEAADGVGE